MDAYGRSSDALCMLTCHELHHFLFTEFVWSFSWSVKTLTWCILGVCTNLQAGGHTSLRQTQHIKKPPEFLEHESLKIMMSANFCTSGPWCKLRARPGGNWPPHMPCRPCPGALAGSPIPLLLSPQSCPCFPSFHHGARPVGVSAKWRKNSHGLPLAQRPRL